MKQIFTCMAAAALLASVSSCSSTFHSSSARTRNVTESSLRETNSIADLKVEEQKVTGTSTGSNMSNETAKNLAVYDALKRANADVLVEPNYEIDRTGNSVSVTVHGYPGFYKNFRKPTEQDSLIMGWKVIAPRKPAPEPTTSQNTNTTSNVSIQQTGGASPVRTTATVPAPSNTANSNFLTRAYSAMATPRVKTSAPGNYDMDAYKREKKKGNALLGWGLGLLLAGAIIDGCSPLGINETYNGYNNYYGDQYSYDYTGYDAMLGVGSALIVTGLVLTPIGAVHLVKARHIKQAGLAENLNLSVVPDFNVASNHYGATLALKF